MRLGLSKIIADLLDPLSARGQRTAFLELFIEMIGPPRWLADSPVPPDVAPLTSVCAVQPAARAASRVIAFRVRWFSGAGFQMRPLLAKWAKNRVPRDEDFGVARASQRGMLRPRIVRERILTCCQESDVQALASMTVPARVTLRRGMRGPSLMLTPQFA